MNDSRVAEVVRPPSGMQCSQMMLSPKGLGTTLVTVYDIGVSPPLSALAVVSFCSEQYKFGLIDLLMYIEHRL